ncbi:uncharacterized protein LOC114285136 [Camellia sinensis]|uniref:uncharacterized protein LOC114285136 n=1 Tax=Camellia sinensis TaxID=4442 RepID=UPI00103582DE|nr:uncharacterized protein LOC114285136 [Camellia sinensis]
MKPNSIRDKVRQGRVFTLIPSDVQNTEAVVSGSTHSFVLKTFASNLNRPMDPLNCVLCVSSPSGGSMICASIYPTCEILIGDVHLYANLISVDMDHFDIILGMDWLSKYHATIDCMSKQVVFRPLGQHEFTFAGHGVIPPPYLISAMKACKLLQKGCQGYLCSILHVQPANVCVDNILIIREFPDVFPDDLLGNLVDREIKFVIDVVSRTQPISKAPYRMSMA